MERWRRMPWVRLDAAGPGRAPLAALVLVTLVAAVAVTSRSQTGGGAAAPAVLHHLAIVLYLVLMPLALVATAALLVAALFQRRRIQLLRAREAGGPDALRSHWLARLAAWFVPTLVAALVLLALMEARRHGHGLGGLQLPGSGAGGRLDPRAGSHTTPVPTADWAAALAIWVLAMAVSTALVVRALRRRRPAQAPGEEPPPADELIEAVDTTLDDIRREPDARRAVVAAYAGMESTLAAGGLPRRASEAPFEFLARVLGSAGAGERPLRRLTELFEHARFSQHPVAPAMKDEAIEALELVRSGLVEAR